MMEMRKIITLFFACVTLGGYAQSKLFVNGGTSGIMSTTSSFVGLGPSNPNPTTHLHVLDSYNGELSLLIQNTYLTPGTRTFLTSTPTRSLIQTDKDFGIVTNGGG